MNEVVFPRGADGRRSSSDLGREVVADALRAADPAAADAASAERDWRTGYLRHFRALVEAGDGYAVAEAGLASVRARMRVDRDDAGDAPLTGIFAADSRAPGTVTAAGPGADSRPPGTVTVVGSGADSRPLGTVTVAGGEKPERELTVPYRGELLRGDALHRQLDAWVAAGTIEESCAEMVRAVAAEPGWLDLSDQRLVVLGAGSEMGPLPAVLGWGGTVLGVDLPRPDLWARIAATARRGAGTLLAPGTSVETAGADLLTGLPEVARWLLGVEGRLVLGNYVYAPGAAYARLSAAVDALCTHVIEARPDTALAFLATPTDVFAVPGDVVTQATERYRHRSRRARLGHLLSAERLLTPNYPPGANPGIADSLVPQQGPNYALAKRIQRWRASAARRAGTTVSFSVAPPTRTRSVTANRLLAAAYAGAHLFDVEIFEPATSNKLMAALLVHQLRNPRPAAAEAWRDEARGAAHGGFWRTPYQPRSVLGLAALRGLPTTLR
ncbi:hypothetical protein [Pseudosporangium ferrugineum]|uniref:hypothetical protein n=1 Tax=Pseudosporangium ferrugineum TaxID=439699 RepID=UPI001FEAABED|nr:hypothetical protein [Pseudosporangium ferrugineum]